PPDAEPPRLRAGVCAARRHGRGGQPIFSVGQRRRRWPARLVLRAGVRRSAAPFRSRQVLRATGRSSGARKWDSTLTPPSPNETGGFQRTLAERENAAFPGESYARGRRHTTPDIPRKRYAEAGAVPIVIIPVVPDVAAHAAAAVALRDHDRARRPL